MVEIVEVDFKRYIADLDSPDKVVKIEFSDENKKTNRLETSSILKIRKENDSIHFEVKKRKNVFASQIMIYTKDTLFFEPNKEIKDYAKKFLKNNDEIMVIKSGKRVYVGKPVNKFEIYSERLLNKDKELTKKEQTEVFKAYETPSNIFELYFSLLQKENIDFFTEKKAMQILDKLKKIEELENNKLIHKKNTRLVVEAISNVLQSFFLQRKKIQLEEADPTSNLKIIEQILKKYARDELKEVEKASGDMLPIKNFNIDKITIPVLDMQAGSGEGIFKKDLGFNFLLFGTEIRTKEEINKPEYTNIENNKVFYGIDTNTHISDYKNLFFNNRYAKAVLRTIVYQNPPYTANNELAKESLLALRQDMNIFGLYPVSMKDFLQENVNGFIFTVPREITGYQSERTPKQFLFVIGSRHDQDYIENILASKRGSLISSDVMDTRAKNIHTTITETSLEEALQKILKTLRNNKNLYDFKKRTREVITYSIQKNGQSPLIEPLGKNIQNTKELISDIKIIEEEAKKASAEIMSKFNSNEVLRNEKIFPDYRNYSEDRKYEKFSYKEVLLNRSLLVFYRDKYPEIFKVIKNLAEEDGIELGLEESFNINYSLSNPKKPEKKDIVSAESLGMMKLAYYPTSFALFNKDDKEALKKIIFHVYKKKNKEEIPQNIVDAIDMILEDANRLIIKYEDVIDNELNVNKKEVFAFVDEDGIDIAKLNISLTDFFNSMEELKMFDIRDYVESAVISEDKKRIIFDNFIKNTENLIYSISAFSLKEKDINKDELEKKVKNFKQSALKTLIEIKKMKENSELTSEAKDEKENRIYLNFAKENGIYDYYRDFIKITDVKKILNKLFFNNAIFIKDTKKIENELNKVADFFNKMPISFFESERENSENLLKEVFHNLAKKDTFSKEALFEAERNFIIDVYEELSSEYEIRKAISEASIKIGKLTSLVMPLIESQIKKGVDKAVLYDVFFEKIAINTFGLMPHQFKNAERFVEISNDKKVDILNWEMRSGKTLTFLNELWMLSLYKGTDSNLFLETKTFNDIVSQAIQFLPILVTNMKFNLPNSLLEKTIVNSNKVNEFREEVDIFPNLPKILNPYFIKKGIGQLEELERFGFEFEDLLKKVKEKKLSLEEMREKYKDSLFCHLLNGACT